MSVRAVVMVGPGELELREFPGPKLEQGTMLVRMIAAGICGTDRHIFDGHMPLDFPVIPGHETIGVVEEIAGEFKDVHGRPLAVGDRVVWDAVFWTCGECFYCKWLPSNYGPTFCERLRAYGFENCENPPHLLGGWAEQIVIVPGSWVYRVPDELSDEQAVLVDPLASASGVERAVSHCSYLNMGLGFGQTAVVLGSGTVGIFAAVKAQLLGATRIVMVGGPASRLELATEFGVDETLDINDVKDPSDRVRIIRELTDGVGADMVVECAGVPAAVTEGLEMLRHGGVFVETGHYTDSGSTEINPFRHLCYTDVTLIGQWGYSSAQYRKDLSLMVKHRDRFPFEKLVTHRFALSDYGQAIKAVKQEECLKAVLVP
jgi:threonine dehydrogenase-like Zn-dependent dehydrogenase